METTENGKATRARKNMFFMDWIKGFVTIIISLLAGGLLSSFGLIPPIAIIRSGYPLIRALEQHNLIDAKAARRKSGIAIVLFAFIDSVVLMLMIAFANTLAWFGFAFGAVCMLFVGIENTAPNDDNKDNFIQSYGMYFDKSKLCDIWETLYQFNKGEPPTEK